GTSAADSPRRIRVQNGRAVAVETTDGTVFRARHFIASGLNPQQTFLELLAPQTVPREWRDRARQYRYNLLAPLFALHLALKEPPDYIAARDKPYLKEGFMVILGLE